MNATSTFKIESWDEQPYAEHDDTKLTKASVTQSLSGDLSGTATIESLSFYRPDQSAEIVGLQRVEGTLDDKQGTFVLRSEATFDGKTAKGRVTVVPGSGTGDLHGLTGTGEWSAVSGPDGELTLEYDFRVTLDRAGNLLGALSLAVADRTSDAIGHPPSTAAALSALSEFLDEPSVDRLRQVLGLTASGTVRLVDRLEGSGLVTRGPGQDGRSIALHLTPAGRSAAAEVSRARAAVLTDVLAPLTPERRAALEDLLVELTPGLISGPGAKRWMCRMCDLSACGRPEGRCPVANEARARYGQSKE